MLHKVGLVLVDINLKDDQSDKCYISKLADFYQETSNTSDFILSPEYSKVFLLFLGAWFVEGDRVVNVLTKTQETRLRITFFIQTSFFSHSIPD